MLAALLIHSIRYTRTCRHPCMRTHARCLPQGEEDAGCTARPQPASDGTHLTDSYTNSMAGVELLDTACSRCKPDLTRVHLT